MKKILLVLISALVLLSSSLSESAVNSKEQNFTQNLTSAALSATTTFSTLDAGFLSVVSLHFSAAPASAETIKVFRNSRAGVNFNSLIATYTTTAGSTTDVTFVVGNAIPVAETDQVRITCTNNSAATTVYVSVVLDTAPRGSAGVAVYDNGALKISSLSHDYHWHFGDIVPDANQSFGAYYSDLAQIAAPANPGAGTRRLFVDSGTGELSVRTSAGSSVSLENGGIGSTLSFVTWDVPAGTDPVADVISDTITLTETSPLVITGTAGTDTIDITWSSVDVGADGTIQSNSVALTTDTTGDYVGSVATTAPLSGGAAGSEAAALTLSITANGINATQLDETADYTFTTLSGKQDRNNSAVDDDDCTGEQGLYWYDTTDSAFEFCNANTGVPTPLAGSSETDPTLTNDGAVTVGSGAVNPTVLTFDSDAGTDGTITWDGASDDLEIIAGDVGIGTASPGARLQVVDDGTFTSNEALLRLSYSPGAGGLRNLTIQSPTTDSASAPFHFETNNAIDFTIDGNMGLNLTATGQVGVGTSALNTDSGIESLKHVTFEGTAPTVSACGTTPSIVGTDNGGKVTTGSTAITSCTLTFALAWTNAPACVANNETNNQDIRAVSTTTTLILTTSSADFTSDVLSYICIGRG